MLTALMDVAALVIAIVSITLAAISLGWQIVTYLLTGARVKAELRVGAFGNGGAVSAPVDSPTGDPELLAAQGYDRPILAVLVRNIGRMSINIESVAVRLTGGMELRNPAAPYNPQAPYRLEPHSSQTWYFDYWEVWAAARGVIDSGMAASPITARGVVDLGDGRRVMTPETLPVRVQDQSSGKV